MPTVSSTQIQPKGGAEILPTAQRKRQLQASYKSALLRKQNKSTKKDIKFCKIKKKKNARLILVKKIKYTISTLLFEIGQEIRLKEIKEKK